MSPLDQHQAMAARRAADDLQAALAEASDAAGKLAGLLTSHGVSPRLNDQADGIATSTASLFEAACAIQDQLVEVLG